jgi:ectoine hydroxylase-related dioxygenase (phytanoyl-CoA dioxygenase family)
MFMIGFAALCFLGLTTPVRAQNFDDTVAMKEVFDRDGYLLVRKIVEKEQLAEWQEFSAHYFLKTFQQLHEKGLTPFPEHGRLRENGEIVWALEEGLQNRFPEVTMTGPGRYELSLAEENIVVDMDVPSIEFIVDKLSKFIPQFLEHSDLKDLNTTFALSVSSPGNTDETWHTDSGHVNMEEHMPAHCLNVYIPLDDITPKLGPTEMIVGSHHETRQPQPYKIKADPSNPPRAPSMKVGDAFAFDCRLLHRGKPNRSDKDSPMLMFTFSHPSLQDAGKGEL